MQNLSPMFSVNVPAIFLQDRMENFLICRRLAEYLREKKLMAKKAANFFEELSLTAIHFTFATNVNLIDINLLIAELPKILKLNYPEVENIRKVWIKMMPQVLNIYRVYDPNAWRKFVNLKYLTEMLVTFDDKKK